MKALELLDATVGASTQATEESKARARKASLSLGDASNPDRAFVFNAFLNLVARGAPPTEANILAESKRIARANEAYFAAIRKNRSAKVEAA